MKTGLIVKRPKGATKSYSVIPYHRGPDGKLVYGERLHDDALDQLNRALKSGKLKADEAKVEFEHRILPRLKGQSAVQDKVLVDSLISNKNMAVYHRFWKAEYGEKSLDMSRDGETAQYEFKRALKIIEPLSIQTATREELQEKLNKGCPAPAAHKKIGGRLNQLLRFLERGFDLHTRRVPRPTVNHISWPDFKKMLPNIVVYKNSHGHIDEQATKDVRALATFLFGSGVRFAEAFGLEPHHLKPNRSIYISQQILEDGAPDELKNGKPHNTILILEEEAKEAFLHWASLDNQMDYRGQTPYRAIVRAAKKTFKAPSKHINLHDLRHCYVIHQLGQGIPLDKVARLIGDTTSTCELHYAGFVASDVEIDFINDLMKRAKQNQEIDSE